jgi:membrane protein YdbS with pleckstrin-like domain
MGVEDTELLSVEPGYKNVLRVRLAIQWLVLAVPAFVADQALLDGRGLIPLAVIAVGVVVVVLGPKRRFLRLGYRFTDAMLQVVRGWLFHTDTVVPLVRVQHLDVVRGPLDKLFGTASLVVHTAGTHNSTVVLPGLAPERAAEMRDTIREHVRTDFD